MNIIESQTIQIIRRDDVTLNIEFTNENDLPVNISDATVFLTVKKKLNDDDSKALISKTTTTHIEPVVGKTKIELSNADTNIAPRAYYYDLQLVLEGGKVASTTYGRFEVVQDVTVRTEENQ